MISKIMPSFYVNKKRYWKIKRKAGFVLPVFIIAVIIFLNAQGLLEGPKNIFFRIISPFQKDIYSLGVNLNKFADFLRRIKKTEEENIKYQEENQKLKGKIAELREVVSENKFLRQQLGLPDNQKKQLVLVNIIGREPTNLGDYFLIDKGRKDGLNEKSAVIAANNLLVGRIIEVSDYSAKVLLFTHPESRIDVLVQESRVNGLMRGGLIIDWILPNETIEAGQTIITSGLSGLFPKGLLVGEVEEVIFSDAQIFKRARVKPAADLDRLEMVFVIK